MARDLRRIESLLGISPSSAARYARGERSTPDAVAARLHFIAIHAPATGKNCNNSEVAACFPNVSARHDCCTRRRGSASARSTMVGSWGGTG